MRPKFSDLKDYFREGVSSEALVTDMTRAGAMTSVSAEVFGGKHYHREGDYTKMDDKEGYEAMRNDLISIRKGIRAMCKRHGDDLYGALKESVEDAVDAFPEEPPTNTYADFGDMEQFEGDDDVVPVAADMKRDHKTGAVIRKGVWKNAVKDVKKVNILNDLMCYAFLLFCLNHSDSKTV